MEVKEAAVILEFRGFLDSEGVLPLIEQMLKDNQTRLIVDINDLRNFNRERAASLLSNPLELGLFEQALNDLVHILLQGRRENFYRIGLIGCIGSNHVTPALLTSRLCNKIVCVEGFVTEMTPMRFRPLELVYSDPKGRHLLTIRPDAMTADLPLLPQREIDGLVLKLKHAASTFAMEQTVTIQQRPCSLKVGQIQRWCKAILRNDLVDSCKPGDHVQIMGIAENRFAKKLNSRFADCVSDIVIYGNNVIVNQSQPLHWDQSDIELMRKVSKRRDCLDFLCKSFAPSIMCDSLVKMGLLCQQVGGVEKILPNGSRLRGDIHVLLVGEPATGKSQLLRFVNANAPISILTSGRSSSGVGLTASVDRSEYERDSWTIKAGACVIADTGTVCLDEFDKIIEGDRAHLHEIMEQGTVSINKASIKMRLNARCKILAAANPVGCYYNSELNPSGNLNLQDSLISRFDLVFLLRDEPSWDRDGEIADKVTSINRTSNTDPLNLAEGDFQYSTFDQEPLEPFRYNKTQEQLNYRDLWKYIQYASTIKPSITEYTNEVITDAYVNLRQRENNLEVESFGPITPRSVEAMIRLATSFAKLRLSPTVDQEDAVMAADLYYRSNFQTIKRVEGMTRQHAQKRPATPERETASDGEEAHVHKSLKYVGPIPCEVLAKKTPLMNIILGLASEEKNMFVDIDLIKDASKEKLKLDSFDVDVLLGELGDENQIIVDDTVVYLTPSSLASRDHGYRDSS